MYKQPFSGNRQWGWLINENGNIELFTRAIDVANISKILNFVPGGPTTNCQQNTYYDIADATWLNLQEELEQWISINDGQANIVEPTTLKVDRNKIVELLSSEDTIDQIFCE